MTTGTPLRFGVEGASRDSARQSLLSPRVDLVAFPRVTLCVSVFEFGVAPEEESDEVCHLKKRHVF